MKYSLFGSEREEKSFPIWQIFAFSLLNNFEILLLFCGMFELFWLHRVYLNWLYQNSELKLKFIYVTHQFVYEIFDNEKIHFTTTIEINSLFFTATQSE